MLDNNNTQEAQARQNEGKQLSELAQNTQRVLSDRKWSLRQAEIQTGVGYTTVGNMRMGKNVEPEVLVKWAEAIKEQPDTWLGYANKPYGVLRPAGRKVELPSGLVVEIYPASGDDAPVVSDADRLALDDFFARQPQ